MRVQHLILLLGLLLAMDLGDARAQVRPIEDPPRHRLGMTLGSPQTLAISYEYALSSPLQIQANVGTALFYSAVGGRVLVVPDQRIVQPYAFVGAVHSTVRPTRNSTERVGRASPGSASVCA